MFPVSGAPSSRSPFKITHPHILSLSLSLSLSCVLSMESSSPSHSKLTDTIFMGCPASLDPNFHVDDLLDFPIEDDDTVDDAEPALGSPSLPHAIAAAGGLLNEPTSIQIQMDKEEAALHEELSHGLCVPPDDLFHQLEWLSSFNEDNFFSGGDAKLSSSTICSSRASMAGLKRTCKDTPTITHKARDDFRSESPVSVLEHGGHAYAMNHHVQRASRIRKSRTGGRVWSLDILKPVDAFDRASHDNGSLLDTSYSSAYSEPLCSFLQAEELDRPYKKMKRVSANDAAIDLALVRKCTHCLVQKTPQWRAGPMGPKTLCNACGVRYKSGRLVPEYRPAASPSFVNEIHSNSHRRILEMRRFKEVESSIKHYKSKGQRTSKRPGSRTETWVVLHIPDEHACKEQLESSEESGLSCVEISACEEAKGGVCSEGRRSKEDSNNFRAVSCGASIASGEANLHRLAPNSPSACEEEHMQEKVCASSTNAACEGETWCGKDANEDMSGLDIHIVSQTMEARVQDDEEKMGVYATQ